MYLNSYLIGVGNISEADIDNEFHMGDVVTPANIANAVTTTVLLCPIMMQFVLRNYCFKQIFC